MTRKVSLRCADAALLHHVASSLTVRVDVGVLPHTVKGFMDISVVLMHKTSLL